MKVLLGLSGAKVLKRAVFRTAASECCRPPWMFRWDVNSSETPPGDGASGSPPSAVRYSRSSPELARKHRLTGENNS